MTFYVQMCGVSSQASRLKTSMQVNNMAVTPSEMWMFLSKMQHHDPHSEWHQDFSSQKDKVKGKDPVVILGNGPTLWQSAEWLWVNTVKLSGKILAVKIYCVRHRASQYIESIGFRYAWMSVQYRSLYPANIGMPIPTFIKMVYLHRLFRFRSRYLSAVELSTSSQQPNSIVADIKKITKWHFHHGFAYMNIDIYIEWPT